MYGISDIGSWDCIISVGVDKAVITKSGYWNIEKVKKEFIVNKVDVDSVATGVFKSRIIFKNKIKGLGKKFKFRIQDDFKDKGAAEGVFKEKMEQLAG